MNICATWRIKSGEIRTLCVTLLFVLKRNYIALVFEYISEGEERIVVEMRGVLQSGINKNKRSSGIKRDFLVI